MSSTSICIPSYVKWHGKFLTCDYILFLLGVSNVVGGYANMTKVQKYLNYVGTYLGSFLKLCVIICPSIALSLQLCKCSYLKDTLVIVKWCVPKKTILPILCLQLLLKLSQLPLSLIYSLKLNAEHESPPNNGG